MTDTELKDLEERFDQAWVATRSLRRQLYEERARRAEAQRAPAPAYPEHPAGVRRLDERIDGVVNRLQRTELAVEQLESRPSDPALVKRTDEIALKVDNEVYRLAARIDGLEGVLRTADGELVTDVLAGRVAVLAGAPSGEERLDRRLEAVEKLAQGAPAAASVWDAVDGLKRRVGALESPEPGCQTAHEEAAKRTDPAAYSSETCGRVNATLAGAAGDRSRADLEAMLRANGWERRVPNPTPASEKVDAGPAELKGGMPS